MSLMITLDTTPEPGQDAAEVYYREHGWSGCAGSDWNTLTEATKDGWRHAARLAAQQADQRVTRTEFAAALHRAMVEDDFRFRPDGYEIHPAYLTADSGARATAQRVTDLLTPILGPLLHDETATDTGA